MIRILPLHAEVEEYLKTRKLTKKFFKQRTLFEKNPFHPSLHTELLEPKSFRIWSFRVDQKYRALFIFHKEDIVEIIDINNHYK